MRRSPTVVPVGPTIVPPVSKVREVMTSRPMVVYGKRRPGGSETLELLAILGDRRGAWPDSVYIYDLAKE